ncbi:MAG: hypothetical protein IKU60_06290 [Clostridia bacterium]|nr:hypothetical protein [Clostridia bacterium]
MKASKAFTVISYILQTILFIAIMVLNSDNTAPHIIAFVTVNLICIAVMSKLFTKEVSCDIHDKVYTEYPYINHFKILKYALFSEDKLTRNLLRFQYLFIFIGFAEFILLDILL